MKPHPGEGGGGTWLNFCWVCAAGLSEPIPHYSLFCDQIIDPILVTFGQIGNHCDPNLVTFNFYELTHYLNWMKNTLLFTYSTNIVVCLLTVNMKNCLSPKNPKMCDPIIVNPDVKMQPHPAAHSHQPLIRKYPPPTPTLSKFRCVTGQKFDSQFKVKFFTGKDEKWTSMLWTS